MNPKTEYNHLTPLCSITKTQVSDINYSCHRDSNCYLNSATLCGYFIKHKQTIFLSVQWWMTAIRVQLPAEVHTNLFPTAYTVCLGATKSTGVYFPEVSVARLWSWPLTSTLHPLLRLRMLTFSTYFAASMHIGKPVNIIYSLYQQKSAILQENVL
jgi:hypothetical protein